MATRRIYLAKYRESSTQRAHFAIFIPNANDDRPTVAQDFRKTSTRGTIIHVLGEPLMSGFTQELKRNYSATESSRLEALILLGSIDAGNTFDPASSQYVKENIPRSRLEQEAMAVPPPPKGQNLRAPIDGITTKRCQEWTMEYLQRLVSRSFIHQDAIEIAQEQRDPPTFGVFGFARARPQPLTTRQTAVNEARGGDHATGSIGDWIWDTEHKRYRRWDGTAWVWQ